MNEEWLAGQLDRVAAVAAVALGMCPDDEACYGCGCRMVTPLERVEQMAKEMRKLQGIVAGFAERAAGQSEPLSRRAGGPS